MQHFKIVKSPNVSDDMVRISEYYGDSATIEPYGGVELIDEQERRALRCYNAINESLKKLSFMPERFPIISQKANLRYMKVSGYKIAIIFKVKKRQHTVQVLSVIYQSSKSFNLFR